MTGGELGIMGTEMTKAAFLAAYREKIVSTYTWGSDPKRLESFMTEVVRTITPGQTGVWSHEGPTTTFAWQSIGGKGKPTLKALRELK